MCREIEYQNMTLPNPLDFTHTTVAQVENSTTFSTLSTLADSKCHPRVRDLVCATIVPRCESSPNLRQQLPCRSWCEEVKFSCGELDSWSAFPSCEIFPHANCNNVNTSRTPEGEECFDGNGANYRGDEARGPVSGVDCDRWDDDPTFTAPFPWANLVENKCRNPGAHGDTRPWCFTSSTSGFEYCDVIPCKALRDLRRSSPPIPTQDRRLKIPAETQYADDFDISSSSHHLENIHEEALKVLPEWKLHANASKTERVHICLEKDMEEEWRKIKGCKDPGNPTFGKRRPILKFYWPGETITYTCDTGFMFKKDSPPNKAQCVINNTTGEAYWATKRPNCEGKNY
ncbi:plasminogen-like [Branchiostoma floridae]|uniref:Plasminogen-like n=1 Tax=Branchiostoma floridae TaxID=7739 RepID=A0A9J7KLC5_BRAFL|nr:plasminogen-like [Branchiostoma floridae]